MKKIYTFTINKEIEVEKQEKSLDANNKEIIILKKVKDNLPLNFFVAKPSRVLSESAEIFYASIVSKCISQGILTANLIQKRVLNDGGVLSDEQKKKYNDLYNNLFEKQSIHKELTAKLEQTEEDKETISKTFKEIVDILTEIQQLENQAGNNLYQNTAENIARNRLSIFWMLNLSYKEENGKEIPVFTGKTYEDKLISYDNMEENGDNFDTALINKLFLITSLWYLGKAQNQEEFDVMLAMHENKDLIEGASITSPKG